MMTRFSVDKVHCQSCKALIEGELSDLDAEADVNVEKKEVSVEFDENRINKDKIRQVLSELGYETTEM